MLKRRFIAGAICPRCSEVDRIVMYDDEQNRRYRECVSCGLNEPMEDVSLKTEELGTRVNQQRTGERSPVHELPDKRAPAKQDSVDVVKVIDLSSQGK